MRSSKQKPNKIFFLLARLRFSFPSACILSVSGPELLQLLYRLLLKGIDREPERHLGQAQIQTQSAAAERVLATRADRRLAETLKTAIDAAQRRLTRLRAVAAATLARVRRTALEKLKAAEGSEGRLSESPKPSFPADRVVALAGFLNVLGQEMGAVLRDAQLQEERSQSQLERARERERELRKTIKGMTEPGILSSRVTKQRFEERMRSLHAEGQAAIDAQGNAHRGLQLAKDMQASPQAVAIERIKARDPGLVERMAPLLKDAQLVADARRHLEQQRAATIAASRERLARPLVEKKDRDQEQGR